MTAQSLGAWCKRPGAPVRVDGTRVWVHAAAFIRWREKMLVEQAVKDATPAASWAEARVRKAIAEARLVEIEVAEKLAQVITIEDSTKAIGVILDRVVTLVRGMAPRLSHLGDVVEQAVEAEAELIIAELSEFSDDVLEEPEDEEDAAA